MLWLYSRLQTLRANRDHGATAAEYALLITAIAAVIALAAWTLGGTIDGIFQDVNTKVGTNQAP